MGAAPLQSTADYLEAFRNGAIENADLAAAADDVWPVKRLLAALESTDEISAVNPVATVADLLDREQPTRRWSGFVVEEISKWCGVALDENQTTWNSPWKSTGLYAGWRDSARYDGNAEAYGLPDFRAFVADLPSEADAAIEHSVRLLAPRHLALEDFLHGQLASVAGWAAYLQYLVREDALRGKANPALLDLLAIRLAYDAALHRAFVQGGPIRSNWLHQARTPGETDRLEALVRWQLAYENGYQLGLGRTLAAQPSVLRADRPSFQAAFCIDVRSEIFRRHLEAADDRAQTIGFAGFFGFPVAHQPADGPVGSRCPVLFAPPIATCEPQSRNTSADSRHGRAEAGAWKAFQNSAVSCFSFVESCGLAFAVALGRESRNGPLACTRVAPTFVDTSLVTRIDLAEGALRNMSLTSNFARLVLFCGHGSESANNPHASALDCGACGGHAGDVNARMAVATLNDSAVRTGLAARNLVIPADTIFVAGLHHTGTDEITLFDLEKVPPSHGADLQQLRTALDAAGRGTRRERAPALGLPVTADVKLVAQLRNRVRDIAEVRPEWALANNAAFVAAPRSRTTALKLDGRAFLHDYDAAADPDNKVLTLILCAPVVVASWINLQYYASRVDPTRYGSGNKVLHNVVGGIGVLEGNGGDLKVGLPLQSIHDGEKYVHEPRRLSVFIDVGRERIDEVLGGQPAVKSLFDHGWVHLFALEDGICHRYGAHGWRMIS